MSFHHSTVHHTVPSLCWPFFPSLLIWWLSLDGLSETTSISVHHTLVCPGPSGRLGNSGSCWKQTWSQYSQGSIWQGAKYSVPPAAGNVFAVPSRRVIFSMDLVSPKKIPFIYFLTIHFLILHMLWDPGVGVINEADSKRGPVGFVWGSDRWGSTHHQASCTPFLTQNKPSLFVLCVAKSLQPVTTKITPLL